MRTGYGVADLADHDHVRRLPQHAREHLGEAQADLRVDLGLAGAFQFVLDWVLERVDLSLTVVQEVQAAVQRRGRPRPRRAGHQGQAAGGLQHGQHVRQLLAEEAQRVQGPQAEVTRQQPDRTVLPVQGRQDVDAEVDPWAGFQRVQPPTV